MRIAIVDTLGLCYDGTTLGKRGLGGSESAVILVSKELAKIGFDVTVFNDCTSDDTTPGLYDGVDFRSLNDVEIDQKPFDIIIASRSTATFAPKFLEYNFKSFNGLPDFTRIVSTAKHKVLWMHDTFCDGDQHLEQFLLDGFIDEVFTLSDFHTDYVTNCDHGNHRMFEVMKKYIFQTRNGVGNISREWVDIKKKDPNLFVYNSSVTKGMHPLVRDIWPRIIEQNPEAKLKVIGGYYKFRLDAPGDAQEGDYWELVNDVTGPLKEIYKDSVEFTGIITQAEISKILTEASYMIYPPAFPETFGISALEAMAHNVPLITTYFGALEEVAFDLACYKIPYPIEPNGLFPAVNKQDQINRFVNLTLNAYSNKYLHQQKMYACNQVKSICGWDSVALQWKQHFFNKLGWFLPVEDYRKVSKINHDVRKVFSRRFLNMEELQEPRNKQQKINVIVPVYNAENYIEKCIQSIEAQDYDNYHVYIIDDCSTDSTRSLIYDSIKEQSKFSIIYNAENKGAVCNQIETVSELCNDFDDIIMLVDGDDWLVNDPNIFHKYNNIYTQDVEFTYGSCWSVVDNIPLIAQEYPPEVKEVGGYRDYKFNWNMPYTHLRTFRRHLLNRLDSFDCFKDENGEWLKAGGDTAVFYNLIEAAVPERVVCIPDVVYNYNDANPINDYKVNSDEKTKNANKVIGTPNVKKKILIGIPTARYIEPDTFKAIYDLEVPDGFEVDFQYFYGYNVDQVRNLIADWTVNSYDYLFAVDHDITFPPDTLRKLLSHDKPVVTAIYRQRNESQTLEVYNSNHANIPYENLAGKGLVEIGGCGFGCVLVKKEVFVSVGYPQFVYHDAILHKDTISEDIDFCVKARNKGHGIFVDTSILCGHYGNKMFTVS